MNYTVVTGEIFTGRLYLVTGTQSVTYNSVTYSTGQTFRAITGFKDFTYSGSGTQIVNEVEEIKGGAIECFETAIDVGVFNDVTNLLGMAIEFALNDAEKIVNEFTKIEGFSIELVDFPFYSFEITETRL